MAYITGSVTSANPGADLYAAMVPALTTAGYTLVDTVVISTRTHKIWKSAAASNSANLDWYMDIAYPTSGSGHLSLIPMEFFDPATDLAYRMVYNGTNQTTVDATTYSRHGATGYALESGNLSPNASSTALQVQTSTSAFSYWISITSDCINALSSVNPTYMTHGGLYTPYATYATIAGAALFPLVSAQVASDGTTIGLFSRVPKATALSSPYCAWDDIPVVSPQDSNLPRVPDSQQFFAYKSASPLKLTGGTWNASQMADNYGGLFGYLKNIAHVRVVGTAIRGDTVTIGSDTWILTTPTSSGGSVILRAI